MNYQTNVCNYFSEKAFKFLVCFFYVAPEDINMANHRNIYCFKNVHSVCKKGLGSTKLQLKYF